MAIKLTPESFLNVVRQSNLVTGDVLKRVVAELREEGAALDNSRAIADLLVERNLLTRWQADKLLQGKHKGFFLGKYRLLRLLGKGGMSSVYLAEHVLMRRQCAIKVLPTKRVNDTSYLGRFHREAQAVASLDHPNIVRAYDVDKEMEKDAEIHFLVMEFVDGRSLQEMIQQDGPLDFQTAADYIRQSADGLHHAHEAGMVHRDIKPGNLLIDRTQTIKLLDMGLARFFHESEEESLTVAHDEKVLGTADYLAPEQALDSHSVDARADLYSLGCTFYFLLTGHPPFTEGTLAQRLMCHQTKQPPAVTKERPDVPKDLLAILEKMMAKKREERYQTAGEIARDLGAWLVEHASDDWQHAHPGLSGKKSSDSGKNLSAPKKKSSIIAKPKVPVAKPVVKDPTPTSPLSQSDTATDPGNELSAFLANLGSSSSGLVETSVWEDDSPGDSATHRPSDRPNSSKVSPLKQPAKEPPSSGRVQTAKPVPTGKPAAQAVPAKPVAKAKAVAAEQPQRKKPAVPEASTAVFEEPDFPQLENERSIDTSTHLPALTVADTSSKPSHIETPASGGWKMWLKDKRVLAGLGGVLVVLLGLGIYLYLTSGEEPGDPGSVVQEFDPNDPGLIGKPIRVGTKGEIPSLKQALDYVATHYDPFNATDPQEIELAAGEVFAEGIHLENSAGDDFPVKVRIQTDPQNPATLKPPGTDPVITLGKGINDLHVEHLKIEADGRPTAIHLQGKLENTHLKGLSISGYQSVGIKAESVFGSPKFGDEERAFVIEDCTLSGAGKETTAIRLENTGNFVAGDQLEEIVIRRCRFLGPMKTGLEVKNAVTSLHVLSNIFAGEETGVGIEWTGATGLNRVLIGNNTFYNLSKGMTFTAIPAHMIDSGIHRNLFAEIKEHEAALLEGDATEFANKFLKGPALQVNVTTGGKVPEGELNLFAGKESKTELKIGFASTEPASKEFLAPKDAESLPKPAAGEIRIGSLTAALKPYVGAVER